MNKAEIQKRLKQRINEARKSQSIAEADGNSDYYYWEGYVTALDFIDDLLILLED